MHYLLRVLLSWLRRWGFFLFASIPCKYSILESFYSGFSLLALQHLLCMSFVSRTVFLTTQVLRYAVGRRWIADWRTTENWWSGRCIKRPFLLEPGPDSDISGLVWNLKYIYSISSECQLRAFSCRLLWKFPIFVCLIGSDPFGPVWSYKSQGNSTWVFHFHKICRGSKWKFRLWKRNLQSWLWIFHPRIPNRFFRIVFIGPLHVSCFTSLRSTWTITKRSWFAFMLLSWAVLAAVSNQAGELFSLVHL